LAGTTYFVFGADQTDLNNSEFLFLADGDLPGTVLGTTLLVNAIQQFVAAPPPLTAEAACFLAGTRVATLSGSCAVEDLAIGQQVRTADGGIATVRWVGRQQVHTRFGPVARHAPIRVRAGALGPDSPYSDLYVTADHALLVDDVLCQAGALVNGTTITPVPISELGDRYTVYHVETAAHEVILANGAPAETFVDTISRRAFDNAETYPARNGAAPEMSELPYPRAMSARQLPRAVRARL